MNFSEKMSFVGFIPYYKKFFRNVERLLPVDGQLHPRLRDALGPQWCVHNSCQELAFNLNDYFLHILINLFINILNKPFPSARKNCK